MTYKLNDYKYKNGKIYKKILWVFYKCIDKGPYGYDVGVRKINQLCGINEEVDKSKLKRVPYNEVTNGRYLICFVNGDNFFLNDPLPATLTFKKEERSKQDSLVNVEWENGKYCTTKLSKLELYESR
jgi:hypothetical protein